MMGTCSWLLPQGLGREGSNQVPFPHPILSEVIMCERSAPHTPSWTRDTGGQWRLPGTWVPLSDFRGAGEHPSVRVGGKVWKGKAQQASSHFHALHAR